MKDPPGLRMRNASEKMLLDTHLGDSCATRQRDTRSWELLSTGASSAGA